MLSVPINEFKLKVENGLKKPDQKSVSFQIFS